MELDTIGIDLGKTVFHLVGFNRAGEVVVRRKFSRRQLLGKFCNHPIAPKFFGRSDRMAVMSLHSAQIDTNVAGSGSLQAPANRKNGDAFLKGRHSSCI